jgi:signal transduction histidine kinase
MSIFATWLPGGLILSSFALCAIAAGSWIRRILTQLSIAQEKNNQLARQLATAMEEIDRLAARVQEMETLHDEGYRRFRHDCLNPLASIQGFLRLLQDSQVGELSARQRRYLQSAENGTQSLLKLLEKTAPHPPGMRTEVAPHEAEPRQSPNLETPSESGLRSAR